MDVHLWHALANAYEVLLEAVMKRDCSGFQSSTLCIMEVTAWMKEIY